ncbi:DTW domain-containing protein [Thalassotalea sp. M1531]|uniref:tRNA-uridine aminocarboxypropyltransferase n=1 Tax=Thalassotalea algicola TaxID=2716224 RepID=A0A7Y0Q8T8_9GAMM|nr:tRNA-uridine aminocarboxypropyltransferase [Thalassotalea algicola]NMP32510.1 DTW domain-containing protein [Thalassotalea algicola]
MARPYCQQCQRPMPVCICHLVFACDNNVELIVLQHKKEVNHPKGSVKLLTLSLLNSQTFVGENFDEHVEFQQFINSTKKRLILLFPGEQATEIAAINVATNEDYALVVLDGTWKKAYKMFQLSRCLHLLPQLKLPEGLIGQYLIRSTKKNNALSTLEASCYALQILETNREKYSGLLKSFGQFNQIQLSFRK